MIFVAATDERTLWALPDEARAIAHCEGIDVEAGTWLFWDDRGQPLEARFTVPNERGWFTVRSGEYTLVPGPGHHAPLAEALDEVQLVEGQPPFESTESIRRYLESRPR